MADPVSATALRMAAKAVISRLSKNNQGGVLKIVVTLGVVAALLVGVVVISVVNAMSNLLGVTAAEAAQANCVGNSVTVPAVDAVNGIPAVALDAYQKAAQVTGVNWTYIAAIGKVETDHGRFGGRQLDQAGQVRPTPIVNSIGASGPMQFMPPTWGAYGADGNMDGKRDVQNIFDAALGAGRYLKASGAPADMRKAIFAYNRATWYVDKVIAQANAYRDAAQNGSTPAARATTTQTSNTQATTTPARDTTRTAATGSDSAWTLPMAPGSYTLTARFGQAGPAWSSGYHTGDDFAAPLGTPVFAVADGIAVPRRDQSWAGPNFLTIDHGVADGKNVTTWYAHMSSLAVGPGPVKKGQLVGTVGTEGNSSGPHLHFEVRANGAPVNPMTWLAGAGAPDPTGVASDGCGPNGTSGVVGADGAWGGYQNGRIPMSAMCQLDFDPAYLECNAAAALNELNAAYQQRFGTTIGPVGGYRSYEAQVECRRLKGSLCATPGTSNHGWGLAADMAGGGINVFGTIQHRWMRQNGPSYGWVLPSWAQENGSKPEPWHWEFSASGAARM